MPLFTDRNTVYIIERRQRDHSLGLHKGTLEELKAEFAETLDVSCKKPPKWHKNLRKSIDNIDDLIFNLNLIKNRRKECLITFEFHGVESV